jgi:hypothetical protein
MYYEAFAQLFEYMTRNKRTQVIMPPIGLGLDRVPVNVFCQALQPYVKSKNVNVTIFSRELEQHRDIAHELDNGTCTSIDVMSIKTMTSLHKNVKNHAVSHPPLPKQIQHPARRTKMYRIYPVQYVDG